MDLPISHQFALDDEKESDDDDAVETSPDGDPLDWLGRAAGYTDGESWWSHRVEEREDDLSLFEAIREAMIALRQATPEARNSARDQLREAYMRKTLRQAKKRASRASR